MPAPKPQPVKMFQVKEKLLRPALTSSFECYIPKTNIKVVDEYYDTQLLSLSCYETALPGSSLMTNEATDDYTGITQRFVYRKAYDQTIDLNFYVDHRDSQGYKIILFFESWIRYITNDDNTNDNPNFNYRVKYPDEPADPRNPEKNVGYRKDIYLTKFERDFKGDLLTYKFLKAYPIAMSSMPVSYQNSDLLRCRVSFNYDRYIIKTNSQSIESEPKQSIPPGIPDLEKIRRERESQVESSTGLPIIGGGDIKIPPSFGRSSDAADRAAARSNNTAAPDSIIRQSVSFRQELRNRRLNL